VDVVTHREESERGRWTHSTWSPAHLRAVVETFWHSEGTIAARERLLPDGMLELALTLGDRHRCVAGESSAILPVVGVTGMRSRPMVLEHPRQHDVLAVRLRPAGAYALLGVAMHELNDSNVDLATIFGRDADELAERCHAAPSVEERFRLLAEWFTQRIVRSRGVDEAIAWASGQIEQSHGAVPIADLREELGMSKGRLGAAFREQIGVTPKIYARIVRFRRACILLDIGTGSLADVALTAGYYDQPHMNMEFRELAGLTPRQFLASRYPGGSTAVETEG
jgi:AraC-like DNA-binding protein